MADTVMIDSPIGLPPMGPYTDRAAVLGSPTYDPRVLGLPVAEITPCVPNFTQGANMFRAEPLWDRGAKSQESEGENATPPYLELLRDHGFWTLGNNLKLAYIADSFPTDTFNNEYGESILERFTGTASQTIADVSQIMGARDLRGGLAALEKITRSYKDSTLMDIISGGLGAAGNVLDKMKSGVQGLPGGGMLTQLGGYASKILSGARLDFPDLWKESTFKPSYTMTVRLYNPNPGSVEDTNKYIMGPLTAILLLACPISRDGVTYNWPYIHKIRCRGIYNLQTAFISAVTVIKGGDQHQIGYNQRLGMVDIRIDFGSLFGSMISISGDKAESNDRPTVRNYISELMFDKMTQELRVDDYLDYNPPSTSYIPEEASSGPLFRSTSEQQNSVSTDQGGALSNEEFYKQML